jgi:hypothetical protein
MRYLYWGSSKLCYIKNDNVLYRLSTCFVVQCHCEKSIEKYCFVICIQRNCIYILEADFS